MTTAIYEELVTGQHLNVSTLKTTIFAMNSKKRATVYFESEVHRALRLKAAAMYRSISAIVNDAAKATLAEDAEDLAAFSERKKDKSISFGSFVQGLERHGRI